MTKTILMGLIGSWMALLASTIPARAGTTEGPHAPETYVVLVGISKYTDPQIQARPHAEEDACALYDLFTDKKYLGVEADHVRLLLGEAGNGQRNSQPATHDNILSALRWVVEKAKRDDLVIFAFIGQGGSLGERADRLCYFASDSTVKDMAKNAVAAASIGEILDKLKSQRFSAFVDVYFKGYTTANGVTPEPTLGSKSYKEFLGHEAGEDGLAAPGRVLFLATNGLIQPLDLKKHGLFTQVLLEGLRGKADKEGYEPDGMVTVDEMAEYLNKEVPGLVRQQVGNKDAKDRPAHIVLGGSDSHFALSHNPDVMPKVQARLKKFNSLVADHKQVTPTIAEEGRRLLTRMPKLETQKALRKAYQQLADGDKDVPTFLAERDKILASAKLDADVADNFAEKVMKVVKLIHENHVKEVTNAKLVEWAVQGLYREAEEKIPAEISKRLDNVKNLDENELQTLLVDARMRLGKREDLDKHRDIDYTLRRMLKHLDPYTTYIDSAMLSQFRREMEQNYAGIGIQIRKDSASSMLMVVTPILNSPAYKAGIQAGDLITTITREVDSNGNPLDKPEVISTKELPLSGAVDKILGKPGTRVKVTVQREGVDKPLQFELLRDRVEVETVLGFHRKSNDRWDYFIDHDNKIAYIRLTTFARNSYKHLASVVTDLASKGIRGFILDLRFNPGGLLDSAKNISDLFIDDGLIVSIRPRAEAEYHMVGKHEGSYLDFPMVCLINGQSASGSEIVSACLQDHNRAYIVGERSYGKGSVQNVQDFDGGQIKLTTASFWRPSGKNLNKTSTAGRDQDTWGVVPDKVVPLSRKERDELFEAMENRSIIARKDHVAKNDKTSTFKDRQLEAALEYLRGQIKIAGRTSAKKAN